MQFVADLHRKTNGSGSGSGGGGKGVNGLGLMGGGGVEGGRGQLATRTPRTGLQHPFKEGAGKRYSECASDAHSEHRFVAPFLQTRPNLVAPLKLHSLPPRICPPTLSAPSERFPMCFSVNRPFSLRSSKIYKKSRLQAKYFIV